MQLDNSSPQQEGRVGCFSSDQAVEKKPSSMQRKIAEMLGPILAGRSGKVSPRNMINDGTNMDNGVAPMMISPRPDSVQPVQAGNAMSNLSNMTSGTLQTVNSDTSTRMETSENSARTKKSSNDSNASHASSSSVTMAASPAINSNMPPMNVPHVNTSVAQAHHSANMATSAAATAPSAPATLTPQLDRLLRAARHCALPPSPRAEPPPGSPVGTPNQTILLALSHTLPPRMTRPHWCVDDYYIGEKLYTGYASTVFKAQCKRSGETVVLKIYTLAAVCDLYKYQIYREVRVHASLDHENIVKLLAAFQEGDRIIMVQEYADGSDLFTLLHKYGGRLSERLAVQMVLDPFLRVLHYLHSRGIIHRDIKPENILFNKHMVLKLGDFGLAIDMREERPVTRAGTLDYMAPEVLRCPFKSRPEENKDNAGLHYSSRVDSWAVGVLTFELLAGYPPFFDQSRTNTEHHINTKIPEFPPTMSEEAKDFIARSLNKNAATRPTIYDLLCHTWVDQYRARRSVRNPPAPSPMEHQRVEAGVPLPTAMQIASSKVAQLQLQQQTQQRAPVAAPYIVPQHAQHMAHGNNNATNLKVIPHMMSSIKEDTNSAPSTPTISHIPTQFANPFAASMKQQMLTPTRMGVVPQATQSHPYYTNPPPAHPVAPSNRLPSGADAYVNMNVSPSVSVKAAQAPSTQVMARAGAVVQAQGTDGLKGHLAASQYTVQHAFSADMGVPHPHNA